MEHSKDATWLRWLREIKKDMNGKNKQAQAQILQEMQKILKKIPNERPLEQTGSKGSG